MSLEIVGSICGRTAEVKQLFGMQLLNRPLDSNCGGGDGLPVCWSNADEWADRPRVVIGVEVSCRAGFRRVVTHFLSDILFRGHPGEWDAGSISRNIRDLTSK